MKISAFGLDQDRKRRVRHLAGFVYGALILSGGQVLAAPAPNQLSHRAIYELSLAKAKDGAAIADVKGRMAMEWQDACDGYTFTQRLANTFTDAEGGQVTTDYSVSSWEAGDGKTYRFSSRQLVDGKVAEEMAGKVVMAEKGGTATYTKPEAKSSPVDAGVIFPTAHSDALVKAALAGETRTSHRVFDGSGGEEILDAIAFISARKPADPATVTERGSAKGLLGKEPYWDVRLAYYPIGKSPDMTPTYQVAFRLYANGVSSHLTLDYGDFTLHGKLSQLDELAKPGC